MRKSGNEGNDEEKEMGKDKEKEILVRN